jgi:branched-chain amino acid transport system substrate-binding protein
MEGMSRLGRRCAVGCLMVAMVAAGCGNRSAKDDAAAPVVPGSAAGAPSPLAPNDEPASSAPAVHGAPVPGGNAGTAAAAASPAPAGTPAAGATGKPATAPSGSRSAAAQSPATPAAGPSPSGSSSTADSAAPVPDAAPAPAPLPEAQSENGKPVIVGNVGTYTGPAGGSLKNLPEGVQVWVKAVNDRGGIKGHKVQLVVVDDGGDPARHRAAVQDLVENKKVIAFLGNGEAISGQSSVEYLTQKKIAVIGNEGGSDWFYSSPVYFAPFPTGDTYWRSFINPLAQTVIPQGKTKFGSMACVEAVTCEQGAKVWHDQGVAKKAGFEPVYRASISLAQPDYTAECLAAQRAGAQVIAITADDSTVSRIAASCGRQNYRPVFSWVVSATKIRQVNEENLNNGVVVLNYFPWLKSDTPATLEFQTAMKKFFKGAIEPPHAGGWVSAKVFEKAAERTDHPEEAAGILDGLYGFTGETVDGLTGPLTFARGQNSPRQECWAGLVIKDKKWTLLGNGSITCK